MALLRLTADTLELRTALGSDTTLVWRRPGPRALGVEVIGNPRTMYFIPYGYTIGGSNTSYTLRKGSARKKVIISPTEVNPGWCWPSKVPPSPNCVMLKAKSL